MQITVLKLKKETRFKENVIIIGRFRIISELEMHMKEEHEDYPNYECDTCKMKFITKWRLKKHVKMHKFKRIKKM